MNDLQDFYNNQFKTCDMPEWQSLTQEEKHIVEKNAAYQLYRLHAAKMKLLSALAKDVFRAARRLQKLSRREK